MQNNPVHPNGDEESGVNTKSVEMLPKSVEILPGQDDDDRDPTLCKMQEDGKFICANLIDDYRDCIGGSDGLCPTCRAKQTCYEAFMQKLTSEDTTQQISVLLTFLLQLWQMSVGSLLILFTPLSCGDHACSASEKFSNPYPFYLVVLLTNFATFIFMFVMYIYELRREDYLIKIMDVDENFNNDGDDVANRMKLLTLEEQGHLAYLNWWYKYSFYGSLVLYLVNGCFSLSVVSKFYGGPQTGTAFATNVLFIVKKLLDIRTTVYCEDNVYFSAYMLQKVQFNHVDPIIQLRGAGGGADGTAIVKRKKNKKRMKVTG